MVDRPGGGGDELVHPGVPGSVVDQRLHRHVQPVELPDELGFGIGLGLVGCHQRGQIGAAGEQAVNCGGFSPVLFGLRHAIGRGEVAHSDLREIVQRGIREAPPAIELWGGEHQRKPADSPAVRRHALGAGDTAPHPPSPVEAFQRRDFE